MSFSFLQNNKLKLGLAGIVLVALLFVFGYCAGTRHGKVNEKLAQNTIVTKSHDSVTKSDSLKAVILAKADKEKEVASIASYTSYASGKSSVTVRNPSTLTIHGVDTKVDTSVTHRIAKADSTVEDLRSTVAAKNGTIVALNKVITDLHTNIEDRDDRLKILEHAANPRFFHGPTIGIGACSNGINVPVPCVNVSYSIGIRFP